MKRQLTPEQIARRDARRAQFKALWKQVAAMPEPERRAAVAKYGFLSCDGASYSPGNMLLIAMQCPGATVLGGFRQWLKHGRAVRKGEHGAMIWVPCGRKEKDVAQEGAESTTTTEKTGFTVGTVFDIGQTQAIECGEPAQLEARMNHDARQFELGIEAFNLAGETVTAPTAKRHEARQYRFETCRYCGERMTDNDEGGKVTFKDGTCAHEDCHDAEEWQAENEADLRD